MSSTHNNSSNTYAAGAEQLWFAAPLKVGDVVVAQPVEVIGNSGVLLALVGYNRQGFLPTRELSADTANREHAISFLRSKEKRKQMVVRVTLLTTTAADVSKRKVSSAERKDCLSRYQEMQAVVDILTSVCHEWGERGDLGRRRTDETDCHDSESSGSPSAVSMPIPIPQTSPYQLRSGRVLRVPQLSAQKLPLASSQSPAPTRPPGPSEAGDERTQFGFDELEERAGEQKDASNRYSETMLGWLLRTLAWPLQTSECGPLNSLAQLSQDFSLVDSLPSSLRDLIAQKALECTEQKQIKETAKRHKAKQPQPPPVLSEDGSSDSVEQAEEEFKDQCVELLSDLKSRMTSGLQQPAVPPNKKLIIDGSWNAFMLLSARTEVLQLRHSSNIDCATAACGLLHSILINATNSTGAVHQTAQTAPELSLREIQEAVKDWLITFAPLLRVFCADQTDQLELIFWMEEKCHCGSLLPAELFSPMLCWLYTEAVDVLEEDAILAWAEWREAEPAQEFDFFTPSRRFVDWLKCDQASMVT